MSGLRGPAAYLFLLPAMLFLGLFALVPTLQIGWTSLQHAAIVRPGGFAGAENYLRLAADPDFWWAFANSLLMVAVTPVLMVLSLSLALLVRDLGRAGKGFRAALFLPVVTPVVIAGIIWRWIFAEDNGLMNHLLGLAHLPALPWLTVYPVNLVAVMLVVIWRGLGYYMLIFLAGLAAVPREVEEAAMLDGAGRVQTALHVLVPMLRPTLTLVFVVSATAAIRTFTEIYVMMPGAPASNKTLVAHLYHQAFERFDFGAGSAVAVVVFLATLAFSLVNVRLLEGRT